MVMVSLRIVLIIFLKKVTPLVSLDCGTNDAESIAYAKEKGIEIIVIDHRSKSLGSPLSIIIPS